MAIFSHRAGGVAALGLTLATPLAMAAAPATAGGHRFQVQASLTPTTTAATSEAGRWQLHARLSPASAGPSTVKGDGYTLTSRLSAETYACYADTIFRDDFDGDGL